MTISLASVISYFTDKTKIPEKAILVSMDVTSLYTNIPQEEGIETICRSGSSFYQNKTPYTST